MKFKCENHSFIESLFPNSSYPECFSSHFIDEYTFIHFLSGIGSKIYFKNTNFNKLLASHLFWEYLETNEWFRNLIFSTEQLNGSSTIKYEGDSFINFLSDNIVFYLGYSYMKKNKKIKKTHFLLGFIFSNFLASIISQNRFGMKFI